eukprot:scpid103103/ scgid30896/ 
MDKAALKRLRVEAERLHKWTLTQLENQDTSAAPRKYIEESDFEDNADDGQFPMRDADVDRHVHRIIALSSVYPLGKSREGVLNVDGIADQSYAKDLGSAQDAPVAEQLPKPYPQLGSAMVPGAFLQQDQQQQQQQ